MLMEMLDTLEKPTEDNIEQENGTDVLDGVGQEESDQGDDDSSEVRDTYPFNKIALKCSFIKNIHCRLSCL